MGIDSTRAMLEEELESVSAREIIQATAENLETKKKIHKMALDFALKGEIVGQISKRDFGLLFILEGLTILGAARETDQHTNN